MGLPSRSRYHVHVSPSQVACIPPSYQQYEASNTSSMSSESSAIGSSCRRRTLLVLSVVFPSAPLIGSSQSVPYFSSRLAITASNGFRSPALSLSVPVIVKYDRLSGTRYSFPLADVRLPPSPPILIFAISLSRGVSVSRILGMVEHLSFSALCEPWPTCVAHVPDLPCHGVLQRVDHEPLFMFPWRGGHCGTVCTSRQARTCRP